MVSFNRKRLQVFVSSTFTDLVVERQAAVEAILTAGHIPAGMELFAAGDESQMQVIRQWIDESDVYLLILGARYGSVEPNSGKSYTQLEYEYAITKGIPLFACVINDAAIDARVKIHGRAVLETVSPAALAEFRELVLTKMVKFWDDHKDIRLAIGQTLAQFARRDDLVGWVRSESQANLSAVTDEITRLSRENAHLRSIAPSAPQVFIQGLDFAELEELLRSKGLLEYLFANRTKLSARIGMADVDAPELDELSVIGLVQRNEALPRYFQLSSAGRLFLNKLELIRTRDAREADQQSETVSGTTPVA